MKKNASLVWKGNPNVLDGVQKHVILNLVSDLEDVVSSGVAGPYTFEVYLNDTAVSPAFYGKRKTDLWSQFSDLVGLPHVGVTIRAVPDPQKIKNQWLPGPWFLIGTVGGKPLLYNSPSKKNNPRPIPAAALVSEFKAAWTGWEGTQTSLQDFATNFSSAVRVKDFHAALLDYFQKSEYLKGRSNYTINLPGNFTIVEKGNPIVFHSDGNPAFKEAVVWVEEDRILCTVENIDGVAGWGWNSSSPGSPKEKYKEYDLSKYENSQELLKALSDRKIENIMYAIRDQTYGVRASSIDKARKLEEARLKELEEEKERKRVEEESTKLRTKSKSLTLSDVEEALRSLHFEGPSNIRALYSIKEGKDYKGTPFWECTFGKKKQVGIGDYNDDWDEWSSEYRIPLEVAIEKAIKDAHLSDLLSVAEGDEDGSIIIFATKALMQRSEASKLARAFLRSR